MRTLLSCTIAALALAACDAANEMDEATALAPQANAAAVTLYINAGATEPYEADGTRWAADAGSEGGRTVDRGAVEIAGTDDDRLYQTERYGMTAYRLAVENGRYEVRLHFAETYARVTGPGQRVFSVDVEGERLADLDVWAEAGGQRTALVKTVEVDVQDAELTVAFERQVQQPIVNAIEVLPPPLPVTLGAAQPLSPDAFGYNIDQTIRGTARDDRAYNDSLAGLRPGTIRFPGGTISNYWDWEEGDFICDGLRDTFVLANGETRSCQLPNGYQSLDPPSHGLSDFKAELDATGAEAVFVLNMLTKKPERTETNRYNSLRLLRAAQDLGIEVRYVELGNEFYLDESDRDASSDYAAVYPTAEAYADDAVHWMRTIRAEFPDARIAVVGADNRAGDDRRNGWNRALLNRLTELGVRPDALTLHPYASAAQDSADLVAGIIDVPKLVTMGQRRMDSLTRYELSRLPRDLDLWFTEYNLFDRTAPVHGTWAHGLLVASQTLNFLRDERTELLHVHSGIGDAVFGSLFRTTSGFAFSGFAAPPEQPPTVRYGRTASGQALQLVAAAMGGATSATRLDFGPDAPTLLGEFDALEGWMFDGRAILVNLSAESHTVDLTAVAAGATYVQRTAGPLDRVTGAPGEVSESTGTVGATLRLPAYSITVVRR